ncbi:MAG: VOC family protein, partial [Acidobacteriota bacterium]
TEDADSLYQRAVDAGAEPTMPLEDTFWGDRYGKVKDPYGHEWSIATHLKDMTAKEVEQASAAAFG